MYTMTVAPGADASGGFLFTESGVRRHARRPGGSRNHPRHARNLPRKIIPPAPERHNRGRRSIPSDTVISFGDYGYEIMPDGIKRGTFRSYTFFVHAADVTLRNLTIENTAGDSKTHGQAIALYAECDRFVAEYCRILGHQDTLFTGPLPPEEYEPGGFRGRPSPRPAHQRQTILS